MPSGFLVCSLSSYTLFIHVKSYMGAQYVKEVNVVFCVSPTGGFQDSLASAKKSMRQPRGQLLCFPEDKTGSEQKCFGRGCIASWWLIGTRPQDS